MSLSDRVGHKAWKALLLLSLFLCSQSVLAENKMLPSPTGLEVERDDSFFYGRWKSVKGASHYQVWVKNYGRWSFNEKELETSPFTSSFKLPIRDERSLFKVRAVNSAGVPGEYSDEVSASKKVASDSGEQPGSTSQTSSSTELSKFDPEAPPPEPPTSLFTVWIDNTTLKLVWQGSKGAKKYSVEELVDETWISIPSIEFPKINTAIIKNHPTPGPYKFRVRSVGANGRASEPSRPTTVQR